MIGYLNDEDATVSTIVENGWLRTGDLAYFDQDGYLFIMDRLKDTIKYKGFQVRFLFLHVDQKKILGKVSLLIFITFFSIITKLPFQIAPADLEAVLISHPDILDVAVTS